MQLIEKAANNDTRNREEEKLVRETTTRGVSGQLSRMSWRVEEEDDDQIEMQEQQLREDEEGRA
jgi:hypothetical protein